MNVSQIIRKARLNADAIRVDRSISPLWTDEEMVDLVNTVLDHMTPHLRMTHRQFHQSRILSTDDPLSILGQQYDPESLHITNGQAFYILPPDFVDVVRITPIITSANPQIAAVRFIPREINDPMFIEADLQSQQLRDTGGLIGRTGFMYDMVGIRTLRLSPTPVMDFDVEFVYTSRKQPLNNMTTGTVTVQTDGVTVKGYGEEGQDFTKISLPAELLLGESGTSRDPADPVTSDVNLVYPTVDTIVNATTLTLVSPVARVTSASYILSSVPPILEQHHRWMASMVTDLMLRKVSSQLATERMNLTLAQWTGTVLPDLSHPRQQQEPVYTTPYDPGL